MYKDKEKANAKARELYHKNYKEKRKKHYLANREEILEKQKETSKKYRETHLDYYKNHYKEHKEIYKGYMLKAQYGLTLDEYDDIYIEQGGMCSICHKALPKGYSASVDHDHKTNKVRGLLCLKCNTGLGAFDDNPIFLLNAINYVEVFSNV